MHPPTRKPANGAPRVFKHHPAGAVPIDERLDQILPSGGLGQLFFNPARFQYDHRGERQFAEWERF